MTKGGDLEAESDSKEAFSTSRGHAGREVDSSRQNDPQKGGQECHLEAQSRHMKPGGGNLAAESGSKEVPGEAKWRPDRRMINSADQRI